MDTKFNAADGRREPDLRHCYHHPDCVDLVRDVVKKPLRTFANSRGNRKQAIHTSNLSNSDVKLRLQVYLKKHPPARSSATRSASGCITRAAGTSSQRLSLILGTVSGAGHSKPPRPTGPPHASKSAVHGERLSRMLVYIHSMAYLGFQV